MLGVVAIVILAVADSAIIGGRVAQAFSQPIAYARSFLEGNTFAGYGAKLGAEAPSFISIEIDPATGERTVGTAPIDQTQTGALKIDVIGSAASDKRAIATAGAGPAR